MNEDPKSALFVVSLIVAAFMVVSGCWFLYSSHERASAPNVSLASRCEESGGVLIQGVNDTDGTVSEFSVCVPERMLYCADIE